MPRQVVCSWPLLVKSPLLLTKFVYTSMCCVCAADSEAAIAENLYPLRQRAIQLHSNLISSPPLPPPPPALAPSPPPFPDPPLPSPLIHAVAAGAAWVAALLSWAGSLRCRGGRWRDGWPGPVVPGGPFFVVCREHADTHRRASAALSDKQLRGGIGAAICAAWSTR